MAQDQRSRLYRLIVGEIGNEIGHIIPTRAKSEGSARRALARALRPYGGHGWGRVEVNLHGLNTTCRHALWWRI